MKLKLSVTFTILVVMTLGIIMGPVDRAHAENPDDILVIANKSLKVNTLTEAEVRRIFTKEKLTLKGQKVVPVNAKQNTPLRKAFSQRVLGMSPQDEEIFWQNAKVRTGVNPPSELSNTIRGVFAIAGGISYCYRKDFKASAAKVLLVL